MNYKQLKEKLLKVDLISAYPFINNYGISTKTNKETGNDELVVEFGVSSKIKFDEINSNYMLPKSLSAYGIDIKTKVTQINQASINFTNDADEAIKYYEKVGKNLEHSNDYRLLQIDYNQYQTDMDRYKMYSIMDNMLSAEINYSYHPSSSESNPIKRNRQKARPLSGGCSSIFYGVTGSSDATLGLFVRDKQDKRIVALSNSHVYARSLLVGEEAVAGSAGGHTSNMLGISARQPGNRSFNPYGSYDPVVDHIGIPKRTSRLSTTTQNKVDGCIVELDSYNLIDASSNNVIWFNQLGPYEFATTEEIDSLMDTNSVNYQSPIFRSGRTLGPLGQPGRSLDSVSLQSPSSTSIVSLTDKLTTNEGFDTLSYGVSSVYYHHTKPLGKSQASIMYTTADETSAFIVGFKNRYDTNTGLFFETRHNGDFSPELAIKDPDGIQEIKIFANNYSNAYVSKTGKIYEGLLFLNSAARASYGVHFSWFRPDNERIPNHRQQNPNVQYGTKFTPVSSSDGSIFSKPVKKSAFDETATFVLTQDNELWTMGGNMCISANMYYTSDRDPDAFDDTPKSSRGNVRNYVCGLPYPMNHKPGLVESLTKLTKIPGEWIDFGYHHTGDDTILYAISASGDLYTAYAVIGDEPEPEYASRYHSMGPLIFNGSIQTPPQLIIKTADHPTTTDGWTISASPDLSHTKVPLIVDGVNIKIKKIFTNSSRNGLLQNDGQSENALYFQTEDDKILTFTQPGGYYRRAFETGYLKYNGVDIVITEKMESMGGHGDKDLTTTFLSGNTIYSVGGNSYLKSEYYTDPWISKLGDGTNYDIQTLLPYNDYFDLKRWDNMPPNNFVDASGTLVYGYINSSYARNSINVEGDFGATIIYTDGIGISGIGYAPSGILGLESTGFDDEIVMTSVDTTVNVGRFLPDEDVPIQFHESLHFKMKNENGAPAAGGDSGSAVFACLSSTIPTLSTFKLVGLLYAGNAPSNTSTGFGVRIDNIVEELDVEPWDGII